MSHDLPYSKERSSDDEIIPSSQHTVPSPTPSATATGNTSGLESHFSLSGQRWESGSDRVTPRGITTSTPTERLDSDPNSSELRVIEETPIATKREHSAEAHDVPTGKRVCIDEPLYMDDSDLQIVDEVELVRAGDIRVPPITPRPPCESLRASEAEVVSPVSAIVIDSQASLNLELSLSLTQTRSQDVIVSSDNNSEFQTLDPACSLSDSQLMGTEPLSEPTLVSMTRTAVGKTVSVVVNRDIASGSCTGRVRPSDDALSVSCGVGSKLREPGVVEEATAADRQAECDTCADTLLLDSGDSFVSTEFSGSLGNLEQPDADNGADRAKTASASVLAKDAIKSKETMAVSSGSGLVTGTLAESTALSVPHVHPSALVKDSGHLSSFSTKLGRGVCSSTSREICDTLDLCHRDRVTDHERAQIELEKSRPEQVVPTTRTDTVELQSSRGEKRKSDSDVSQECSASKRRISLRGVRSPTAMMVVSETPDSRGSTGSKVTVDKSPSEDGRGVVETTVDVSLRSLMELVSDQLIQMGHCAETLRHVALTFSHGSGFRHVTFDTVLSDNESAAGSSTADGVVTASGMLITLRRHESSSFSAGSVLSARSADYYGDLSSSDVKSSGESAGVVIAPPSSAHHRDSMASSAPSLSTIEGRCARLSVTSSMDRVPVHSVPRSGGQRRCADPMVAASSRRSVMIVGETPGLMSTVSNVEVVDDEEVHMLSARQTRRPPPPLPRFTDSSAGRLRNRGLPSAVSTMIEEVGRDAQQPTEVSDSQCSHVTGTSSSTEVGTVSPLSWSPALVAADDAGGGRLLSEREESELSESEQSGVGSRGLVAGQACFALWTDGCYYPGHVVNCDETVPSRYSVQFDDGTSRTVAPQHILPVHTLWRGQSVFVRTASGSGSAAVSDYYDAAIVTGHRVGASGHIGYIVSVDSRNETRAVARSQLLLTRDQAEDIIQLRVAAAAAASPAARRVGHVTHLTDSPSRASISLDNVVDGQRLRRCPSALRSAGKQQSRTPSGDTTGSPISAIKTPRARRPRQQAKKSLDVDTPTIATDSPQTPRHSSRIVRQQQPARPCSVGVTQSGDKHDTPARRTRSRRQLSLQQSPRCGHEESDSEAFTTPAARNGSLHAVTVIDSSSADSESVCESWRSLAAAASSLDSKLFAGTLFLLTCADDSCGSGSADGNSDGFSKRYAAKILVSGGGHIVASVDQLHLTTGTGKGAGTPRTRTCLPPMMLLSDRPLRTAKYISCLAAGVPCVRGEWLAECIRANRLLGYADFLLPAGVTPGGATVPQRLPTGGRQTAALPLRGLLVGVADRDEHSQWLALMMQAAAALGATARHFGARDPDATVEPCRVNVLVVQNDGPVEPVRWALRLGLAVVSGEWLISCVIHKKRLAYGSQPEFANPVIL